MSSFTFSQNNKKREALEEQRQALQSEIRAINKLLFNDKKKEKSQLSLIEDLNYKINVRINLIKITNEQTNLLTHEINTNQNKITELRDELKTLKASYGEMVVRSYKNKNKQSRIMFLLSSSSFKQAYKRLEYLKQYANYQKEQGEIIKEKTASLQEINLTLSNQKQNKLTLINENKLAQNELEKERKKQKTLIASIQENLSTYTTQIKTKQREAKRIDRQINKLIREAIAASNKKAGKTKATKTFELTPEDKTLAANFKNNKGKLPWPVASGVIKTKFGKQPSPIDRSLIIQSNGIRIATTANAKVRAVFGGKVLGVQTSKRSNPWVLIRHGNYISIYKDLGKVYVKKGDVVTTKQYIGEVFTNKKTGEAILKFSITKDTNLQNPEYWLASK